MEFKISPPDSHLPPPGRVVCNLYLFTVAIPVVIERYFLLFLDIQFLLLMAVVTALVALQYRRSESVRASLFGVRTRRLWRDTISATLLGLAGGLLGSILIVLAGLPLTGSGMIFVVLLFLAAMLALISPRFICFAYAGGIICLLKIFADALQIEVLSGLLPINISQVLGLVALLHLVESILIFFSGHLGAVPTFFGDASGRPVGGFTLQKFWPIPLVALTVSGYSASPDLLGGMPPWWPLIKPGPLGEGMAFQYALVSVVAGLGYGDLAIARTPQKKSRISAFYLALYSLILFLLAVWSQYNFWLAPLAALFSPLGHELVIYLGRRSELAGRPAFAPSARGLRVLDVIPGSTAWNMGLRSGDLIISLGGLPVYDRRGLQLAIDSLTGPLEVEFLQGPGQVYSRGLAFRKDTREPLGLLPVPGANEAGYVEVDSPGWLYRMLVRLKEKIKR